MIFLLRLESRKESTNLIGKALLLPPRPGIQISSPTTTAPVPCLGTYIFSYFTHSFILHHTPASAETPAASSPGLLPRLYRSHLAEHCTRHAPPCRGRERELLPRSRVREVESVRCVMIFVDAVLAAVEQRRRLS